MESHVAMTSGGVEGGGGDGSGRELQTEDGEHGVVDEGPGRIAKRLVLTDTEEADEIVQNAIRLLQLQVEADRFQNHILMV